MRNRRNFTNFHILQFQVSRRTMLTSNTFCSSFFQVLIVSNAVLDIAEVWDKIRICPSPLLWNSP